MEEELLSGKDVWYSGVEPVDVGNLDDVKEERQVVPATRSVKLQITKTEDYVNEARTYRMIRLVLKIVDGIDESGKYKGKPIFTSVTYYADPNVYTKDFFKKKQHLIQLKYLRNAIGWNSTAVDGHFLEALLGKVVKGDIIVKKRVILVDDGSGGKEETTVQDNEVRNFKALPLEEQV